MHHTGWGSIKEVHQSKITSISVTAVHNTYSFFVSVTWLIVINRKFHDFSRFSLRFNRTHRIDCTTCTHLMRYESYICVHVRVLYDIVFTVFDIRVATDTWLRQHCGLDINTFLYIYQTYCGPSTIIDTHHKLYLLYTYLKIYPTVATHKQCSINTHTKCIVRYAAYLSSCIDELTAVWNRRYTIATVCIVHRFIYVCMCVCVCISIFTCLVMMLWIVHHTCSNTCCLAASIHFLLWCTVLKTTFVNLFCIMESTKHMCIK